MLLLCFPYEASKLEKKDIIFFPPNMTVPNIYICICSLQHFIEASILCLDAEKCTSASTGDVLHNFLTRFATIYPDRFVISRSFLTFNIV